MQKSLVHSFIGFDTSLDLICDRELTYQALLLDAATRSENYCRSTWLANHIKIISDSRLLIVGLLCREN